ncbi:hypothetical protein AB0E64_39930 [Streptomyces caelestis]|uniref:Uncharacterized protein n=1 Tax=Streptomyces caelestis TaxID=36816 RepID=A0A7W9HB45_9ACTN|nr:hypothetical protein [Streptomyces caelestis]MBB5798714.1 hypothetical protein [Streptomyces caelestis]
MKLRRHGIAPLASRNSARLALATDLPASVLADFTATSISNSTRWTGYAKRTGATQLTGQLLNLVNWLLGQLVPQVRDRLAGAFVAGRLHRERELCGKGGFQPAWCGTAPTMWLDEGGPGDEPYSSGG